MQISIMTSVTSKKGFLDIQPLKEKIGGCKNTIVVPSVHQN